MPEYTYLLDHRLSAAQQNALTQVRDAARENGMTVFLAGGAVRDLTTGSSVRDLDFSVQGNALDLEQALTARGGTLWGKHEPSRTMFFWFPGSVRVEVASTRSETFPKPGQPEYSWNSIVDDLYRRDFTVNAMALSLNEGSYGLLLDPLNGVADIEARQIRLVSNYGFIEDPSRLVRAIRLSHRLGWSLEERTATRYENAKESDNFSVVSPFLRGYELEEIAAEEDALDVLRKLEAEGWMAQLMPAWTAAAADTTALENLHRNRIQLLMQGVAADLTAAHLEVLTAGMAPQDRDALKAAMVRPGLLAQWEGLDTAAKEFARVLASKEAAAPSATWKLFHAHAGEPVLWLAYSRKTPAAETKYKNFFTVWPEAAKKVPVAMMLEMRITPELPVYPELLHELFLQEIDGKLETDEQMRAFLETYSPPAPPPPVTVRRSRGKKSSDGKSKRKGAAPDVDDEDEDEDDRPASRGDEDEDEDKEDNEDEDDDDLESVAALGAKRDAEADLDSEADAEETDEDEEEEVKPVGPPAGTAPSKRINPKLNLDKVDLTTVLNRIAGDDDLDVDAEPGEANAEDSSGDEIAKAPTEAMEVRRGGALPESTSKISTAVETAPSLEEPSRVPGKSTAPKAAPEAAAKTPKNEEGTPVKRGGFVAEPPPATPPAKAAKPAPEKRAPKKKVPLKPVSPPAPAKALKPAAAQKPAAGKATQATKKANAPAAKSTPAPAKSPAKKAAPLKLQEKQVPQTARKQATRAAAKAAPVKKKVAKQTKSR